MAYLKPASLALLMALAACSGAKPEAPKLTLQPILYFDVTQNKLYGSGCNFVPSNGGMPSLRGASYHLTSHPAFWALRAISRQLEAGSINSSLFPGLVSIQL